MEIKQKRIFAFDGSPLNVNIKNGAPGKGFTLFCHGITADWSEEGFNTQIADHFPDDHTCVFMEMRGHGGSPLGHSDFDVTSIVADVIRAFGFATEVSSSPRGNILAASFSSGASLLAAYEMRDRVGKIVLMNPRITYRYWLDDIEGWDSSSETFISDLRGGRIKKGDWVVGPALLNDLITCNAWHVVHQLKNPILTFHGDSDTLVPDSESKSLAEISGAKFVSLPNVDHGIVPTDGADKYAIRERISEAIADWLFANE
ncbi:MAG: alpha/beta hydrolase [Pseudomonadota bacterium]